MTTFKRYLVHRELSRWQDPDQLISRPSDAPRADIIDSRTGVTEFLNWLSSNTAIPSRHTLSMPVKSTQCPLQYFQNKNGNFTEAVSPSHPISCPRLFGVVAFEVDMPLELGNLTKLCGRDCMATRKMSTIALCRTSSHDSMMPSAPNALR